MCCILPITKTKTAFAGWKATKRAICKLHKNVLVKFVNSILKYSFSHHIFIKTIHLNFTTVTLIPNLEHMFQEVFVKSNVEPYNYNFNSNCITWELLAASKFNFYAAFHKNKLLCEKEICSVKLHPLSYNPWKSWLRISIRLA